MTTGGFQTFYERIKRLAIKRRKIMPDNDSLEKRGYSRIQRFPRFEIWRNPEKDRIYINLFESPSRQEAAEALNVVAGASNRTFDLITDHRNLLPVDAAQPEELSECFEPLFDLDIRNVVRVCDTEESCHVCLPWDSGISRSGKGRLLGRTLTFEDADGLLDHQQGHP
jgi:hypothetical protein